MSKRTTPREIRKHLSATGDRPAEAARALRPDLDGTELDNLMRRVAGIRRRMERAGQLPDEGGASKRSSGTTKSSTPEPAEAPDVTEMSRRELVEWLLGLTVQDITEATPGSIARDHAMTRLSKLHEELDTIRRTEAASQKQLTPAEVLDALQRRAPKMPEAHLEIFVAEFCRRTKATVVPRASVAPSLAAEA